MKIRGEGYIENIVGALGEKSRAVYSFIEILHCLQTYPEKVYILSLDTGDYPRVCPSTPHLAPLSSHPLLVLHLTWRFAEWMDVISSLGDRGISGMFSIPHHGHHHHHHHLSLLCTGLIGSSQVPRCQHVYD